MKNNALLIQQALDEANQTVFSARSLRLELLKNCPETIPVLAEWIYEDWHTYDASLTKERLTKGFKGRLNNNQLPLTFVALKSSKPVAVTSLKSEEAPELSDLQDGSCWQGSLHVIPKERNQGLGVEMIKFQATVAKRLGYETIRLYISNPEKARWYSEQGAEMIEIRPFRGHSITIMQFVL